MCLCMYIFSIVCKTTSSKGEKKGHISVEVEGGGTGQSTQYFRYQVSEVNIYEQSI